MDMLYELFKYPAMEMLNAHPFKQLHSREQVLTMLPHFLAISSAFPYIQAGSQLPLILEAIKFNQDISPQIEMTSVVGNFLCWDETGGYHVIEKFGKVGLQKILETKKWFHSNLLRHDIEILTGKSITPDFSEPTRSYLLSLIDGLSNQDAVIRCAYMVAFEMHAHTSIEALWAGIKRNFDHHANELIYFKTHVGGDDPAEAYHVEMVHKMLELVVAKEQRNKFQQYAMKALSESIDWSISISKTMVCN